MPPKLSIKIAPSDGYTNAVLQHLPFVIMHTSNKIITNCKARADIFRRLRGGYRAMKLILMVPEKVPDVKIMAKIAS